MSDDVAWLADHSADAVTIDDDDGFADDFDDDFDVDDSFDVGD